jgi:Notch-like protein
LPTAEVCDNLDNNCNGIIDENFNLNNDPNNCGSCGHGCVVPNGIAACGNGACQIAVCSMGYADCNMTAIDGCEVTHSPTPTIAGHGT